MKTVVSTDQVFDAWKAGKVARNNGATLRTNGDTLWTHDYIIGVTGPNGDKIALDLPYSTKHEHFVGNTAARHSAGACSVTEHIVKPVPIIAPNALQKRSWNVRVGFMIGRGHDKLFPNGIDIAYVMPDPYFPNSTADDMALAAQYHFAVGDLVTFGRDILVEDMAADSKEIAPNSPPKQRVFSIGRYTARVNAIDTTRPDGRYIRTKPHDAPDGMMERWFAPDVLIMASSWLGVGDTVKTRFDITEKMLGDHFSDNLVIPENTPGKIVGWSMDASKTGLALLVDFETSSRYINPDWVELA